jgi:hypothetical protein
MKETTNMKETTMGSTKETEGMTLEQFQQAMKAGTVEVRKEFSHKATADQVTMNGRFGCE